MSDTTTSYYTNLRYKEAQVHSIIEAQYSLKEHLEEITSTKDLLKRAPFVPAKNTGIKHGTLENFVLCQLLELSLIHI